MVGCKVFLILTIIYCDDDDYGEDCSYVDPPGLDLVVDLTCVWCININGWFNQDDDREDLRLV